MDASQKRSIIHRNFSKGNTSEIGDIILECNHCSMKYKHRKSGPTTSLLYHLKVSSHDFFVHYIDIPDFTLSYNTVEHSFLKN